MAEFTDLWKLVYVYQADSLKKRVDGSVPQNGAEYIKKVLFLSKKNNIGN